MGRWLVETPWSRLRDGTGSSRLRKGVLVALCLVVAAGVLLLVTDLGDSASRTSADLRVESVDTPARAVAGSRITIEDVTRNVGQRSTEATRTSYYLSRDDVWSSSDRLLGARRAPALGAEDSSRGRATVTLPASTTTGTWHVVTCADDGNQVDESSHGNNCRARSLVVDPVTEAAADPEVEPPPGAADVPLPAGVTRAPADGGPSYYGAWENSFPADPSFFPIGVWPTFTPSLLQPMGINFMLPLRDDQTGTDRPIWGTAETDDMTAVNATPGFYAGASFYRTQDGRPWGSRAVLNVFGDELDGACPQFFSNLPPDLASIQAKAANQDPSVCADFGGLTGDAFVEAERASQAADPTRPTYIQVTGVYLDHRQYEVKYTMADKRAICANADILSYDYYPVVFGSGPVWTQADYVKEARLYCQQSRPVYAFIETDRMSTDGTVYPSPAQTVAEAWNAIIAGARGIQYFDNLRHLTDPTYDGGGTYAAGAMHEAVTALNRRIRSLAPVLNDTTVSGYVRTTGDMTVLVKYHSGHPYIFAIPHADGPQTVTFKLAGTHGATATVLGEDRTVEMTHGAFTDKFSDENQVHIYRID